ncbi:MAG: ABC transporter substrate-binding protein [Thermodesulfobacteriota bacterium]
MPADNSRKNGLKKLALVILSIWLITGCSGEKPLTLGYIGTPQGLKGAELAAAMANKTGGVRGHDVRIVSLDSAREPSLTDTAISFFDDEDALAIIDNSGAPTDTIPTRGVPFVVITGTVPAPSTAISAKVAAVSSPLDTTGPAMADYLWKSGIVSVSIIVSADDQPYNNNWLTTFRNRYEENKGVVLKIENIPALKMASLADIVNKAVLKETAGLVIIAGSEKALEICRLAKSSRQELPIALADPASTWQIIDEEAPAAQNAIVTRYLSNTNDKAAYRSFEDAFRENFDETPTFSAAAVYDAANMLLTAIKGKKRLKSLGDSFAGISSHQGSLGLIENKDGFFVHQTSLARKGEKGYAPLGKIKKGKAGHRSVKGS